MDTWPNGPAPDQDPQQSGFFQPRIQNKLYKVLPIQNVQTGVPETLAFIANESVENPVNRVYYEQREREYFGKVGLIGIGGPSGAGKTSLINELMDRFPGQMTYLRADNYYPSRDLNPNGMYQSDFDSVFALDLPALNFGIGGLKEGRPIYSPVYENSLRTGELLDIKPSRYVLIDSFLVDALLHSYSPQRLPNVLPEDVELIVNVDVNPVHAFKRRHERDMEKADPETKELLKKGYLLMLGNSLRGHRRFIRPYINEGVYEKEIKLPYENLYGEDVYETPMMTIQNPYQADPDARHAQLMTNVDKIEAALRR